MAKKYKKRVANFIKDMVKQPKVKYPDEYFRTVKTDEVKKSKIVLRSDSNSK